MSQRVEALAFAYRSHWAMHPTTHAAQLYALSSEDKDVTMRAAVSASSRRQPPAGGVGIIPIVGSITYRPSIWADLFGGVSIQALREELSRHLADPEINTIVLYLDTPGGTTEGLIEFGEELRAARARKPILAVVDSMAASAGYWLAAQATEILLTPSGEVGSVGVYAMHVDQSKLNERIGIKPTYIFAGPHKVDGNSDEPISDDFRRFVQARVDDMHEKFIAAIVHGRGRGLTAAVVRRSFGGGRMVPADDAIRLGMADRLFSTPADAFRYAGNSRARADHDQMAVFLAAMGDTSGQRDQVQAQADRDAIELALAAMD